MPAANLYDDAKGAETAKGEAKATINPQLARYWREIERYERATSDWYTEGTEIVDVYLDGARAVGSTARKFALLWANVETLKPAVYAKLPVVSCSRRYKDKDPIGRIAAELMERASNTSLDLYHVDETFRMVRDDRLLAGRGQAWVRYEATIEQYDIEDKAAPDDGEEATEAAGDDTPAEEAAEPQVGERLKSEKVCVDYVHWKDFGHNVARTWATDVWLVWRAVFKTQEEVAERFGGDVAARITYNAKGPQFGSGRASDDPEDRAKIYEVWDRMRGCVCWMTQGYQKFLDSGPPPIEFRDFFPCPEPCYATKTAKELIPVPDYRYYRDQAKEINDLTDKIGRLTEWLVVKGFIPGAPSGIADPIEEAIRDKGNRELFTSVASWTEWSERGGVAKLIDWLPIDKVVQAIQAAINARNQLIQDVFQLTGISDILRGQTNPNETLGAQELKAQTGSRRLANTKDDINRFCRDIARLMTEAIAEQFSPQTLADITGFKYLPPPPPMLMLAGPMQMGGQQILPPQPMAQPQMPGQMQPPGMPGTVQRMPMGPTPGMMGQSQGQNELGSDLPDLTFDDRVVALLRNDKMRSFRIDVETDQTGQADENAEKKNRMELLGAVGGYLDKAMLLVKQVPALGETVKELLMFTTRGFKTGRSLEDVMDRGFSAAIKQAEQALAAAQQNPMTPEMQMEQNRLSLEAHVSQQDATIEQQGQQIDAALESRKLQTHAALATQKQQTDAALKKRQQDIDVALKLRQQNGAAAAQAHDRIAKAMTARPPGRIQ